MLSSFPATILLRTKVGFLLWKNNNFIEDTLAGARRSLKELLRATKRAIWAHLAKAEPP